MSDANYLIVGGGIAGVATAWSLIRLGAENVTLLERERTLGTQSSGLNAAILRTLSTDPLLAEFSKLGADFLLSPPAEFSPVPLVHSCGLVLTADASGSEALARANRSSPELGGVEIDDKRLREWYPSLAIDVDLALYFPREGRIDIAALMAGFESGARKAGARIVTEAEIESLLVEEGRVRGVRLENCDEHFADVTILAAGAWASLLGRAAGSPVELEPRRRHLMVTTPSEDAALGLPVLWHHGEVPFYTRPESGGMLFCACDEQVVHPNRCSTDPNIQEHLAQRASQALPGLALTGIASLWAGMRTFTREGGFAIGRDPELEGLYWVAGLGGHGMVCGGPAGELAARDLLGASPAGPFLDKFSPSRTTSSCPTSMVGDLALAECSPEDRIQL